MKILFFLLLLFPFLSYTQKLPDKITISGTAAVTYEHYGLSLNPTNGTFYSQRRPWNTLRFNIKPIVEFGNLKLPFNFNFMPQRPDFPTLPSVPGLPPPNSNQSLGQYFSNPLNTFSVNPKLKWSELQLGMNYIKYSDLSTGDIGLFGYGVNLRPGKFRFRFFKGNSQQAFNFNPLQPQYQAAYKRKVTMAQIGVEKDGVYFAGFNIMKGIDKINSITNTVATVLPQENVVVTFVSKIKTNAGWSFETELGQCFFTKNKLVNAPNTLIKNFDPFIKTNTSTNKDNAVQFLISKKKKNYEVGFSGRWIGAGYTSMGYPFVLNDRLEYSVNSKMNLWKNKVNVIANIGQRFGNWSRSIGNNRNTQLLANMNVNAQFSNDFNINMSYNNFGFFAPSTLPIGGIRNVGADFNVTPTYTRTTKKMVHLVSGTYNYSKYDEIIFPFGQPVKTFNVTNSLFALYAPSWLEKPYTADFSILYFKNTGQHKMIMNTISSGFQWNWEKKKMAFKSQLSYMTTSLEPYSVNKNLLVTFGCDIKTKKQLTWNCSLTLNLYQYGNEFAPVYFNPSYTETLLRTGLQYRFNKKTIHLKKK
jgi:hypothetical protein